MYEMTKPNDTIGGYYDSRSVPTSPQNYSGLNGPVEQRSCTDLFCCILFVLNVGVFFGIAGYAIAVASPAKVLAFYSYDGTMCSSTSNPIAFMPYLIDSSNISVACVASCPATGDIISCTGWSNYCSPIPLVTMPSADYSTINIGGVYCSPDPSAVTQNVTQFSTADLTQSVQDTKNAYLVLIGAIAAAFILGLIYYFMLKCCAGVLIWMSILSFIIGLIAVGIYMFLYTYGIEIVKVPWNMSAFNKQNMQIVSGVMWGVAVLTIILAIVLYKTIKIAIAVVKCAAIYIADTCHVIFFPLMIGIALMLVIAMYLVALLYVYALGNVQPVNNAPYATATFTTTQIVLMSFQVFSGVWLILYLNGVTSFVLSSTATIWYFSNSTVGEAPHRPLSTSLARLIKYHQGTVAMGSLVLGLFFIIRLLSAFFKSNPDKVGSNRCIQCCVRCLTCIGSIFNICMRFLTKGAYVQCALNGTNYCSSSMAAFKLIATNPIRMALSTGLSSLVTLLGKLAITFIVLIAAYYTMASLSYYQVMIKNPIVPSVICALLAFAISSLYTAVYGVSCNAIIQCFIIDELDAKTRGMKARYCPAPLREIIDDHTYNDG